MTSWMLYKDVIEQYFIIMLLFIFFIIISNISADLKTLQPTPGRSGVLAWLAKDHMQLSVMTLQWGVEMEQPGWQRNLRSTKVLLMVWGHMSSASCPMEAFYLASCHEMRTSSMGWWVVIFCAAAEATGKIQLIQDVTSEPNSPFCKHPYAHV